LFPVEWEIRNSFHLPLIPLQFLFSLLRNNLFGKFQDATLHPTCSPLISEHSTLLIAVYKYTPFQTLRASSIPPKILPPDWLGKLEVSISGIDKEWVE
jgi:hypothetical protein